MANNVTAGLAKAAVGYLKWATKELADDVHVLMVTTVDQAGVAVSGAPSSSAVTVVNDQAASILILAANASRKGAMIENDSTATLYLLLAAGTASATNRSAALFPGDIFTLRPGEYTGVINGIWSVDAAGAARVTEFSWSYERPFLTGTKPVVHPVPQEGTFVAAMQNAAATNTAATYLPWNPATEAASSRKSAVRAIGRAWTALV